MKEIFELLKTGNLDTLNRMFDIEGVCMEIEYTVPIDVYSGLQENFAPLPFIASCIMGAAPAIIFTYNGREFKINKTIIKCTK